MADWPALEAALARQISGERLAHTYRVVDTARKLALRYAVSLEQAEVAALMHDYAKAMPDTLLLEEARRRNLILDEAEEANPYLLHGAVGAALLAEQGLVTDPAVLEAIRWHTTGRPGMSKLEQVVWLADAIEPGRNYPGVDALREAAERDLSEALLLGLDHTITYVVQRGFVLYVQTVHTRNWLLSQRRSRP